MSAGVAGEAARPSPSKKKSKRPTPKKGAGAQRAQRSAVVEQFVPASVAGVVQESSALAGALVYFVPSYSRAAHSKAELEAIVARLGGKVHVTLTVTLLPIGCHCSDAVYIKTGNIEGPCTTTGSAAGSSLRLPVHM